MLITETQTVETMPGSFGVKSQIPSVLLEQTEKSIIESFEKICGSITVEENGFGENEHFPKIVGIISFVGDLTWSLTMVLPSNSAEVLAHKFAGFEIPFDSIDMGDVVGELANVVAGVLCGNLESAGLKSQMSLPTVARGSDFEQLMSENLISHHLHFTTAESHFWVKIIMAKH